MQILFVHQNFPGQFKHLAPALAAKPEHTVVALTMRQIDSRQWQGVHIVRYTPKTGSQPGVHPWLRDFDTKVIRGEACFRAALQLREQGFQPDVIIAHPGWGESLFLKQVWPQARLGLYCEFYYLLQGGDIGFDPEFPTRDADGEACRVEMRNLNNAVHMPLADAAISPTHWQASTFPEPFRSRISVIHDGIDTELVAPDDSVALQLGELKLSRQDEVITFVNRNLEPCRGYHVFMRALPELLRRRPHARVLITGGDGVSYGAAPTNGQTWKQIYIDEAHAQHPDMDWSRVHFLGQIPYAQFVAMLQLSRVHLYLTYPFVLSWSLLEAMSAGCAIVASDTAPLREAIRHDETGVLVDFFDPAALAEATCQLLDDPARRARLGAAARVFARENYDLKQVCLPRQMAWVEALAAKPAGEGVATAPGWTPPPPAQTTAPAPRPAVAPAFKRY